jgi:glycosyltransferase involved in cell wall biosynthesis
MTNDLARIDLHCHSRYSGATETWMARTLRVGEHTGDPADIYRRAKSQGMTHVTLTDRDTIEGGLRLAHHPDFVLGEEITAFFPSEADSVQVLVWGLTEEHHSDIQALRFDIPELVAYLRGHEIAHGLAQPTSLRSSGLRPDQFEQLLLLFALWEVRDGATHNAANDLAIRLTKTRADTLSRLSEKYSFAPTTAPRGGFAGSNDLSGLDVGSTYTEVEMVDGDLLAGLRSGATQPRGEIATTAKTARTLVGLASEGMSSRGGRLTTWFLDNILGPEPPTWLLRSPLSQKLLGRALSVTTRRPGSGGRRPWRMTAVSEIAEALQQGGLGEGPQRYRRLAEIIDETWKRSTVEHFDALREAVAEDEGRAGDELRELAGVQVLLAPYFIAAAFRAREERHASRLSNALEETGLLPPSPAPGVPRVAMFTDTYLDLNGVATVLQAINAEARHEGYPLTIVSCGENRAGGPGHEQFAALERINLEVYSDFPLDIPPLLEMLAWCENERIEVIHAATPGPVGLAASFLARALDLPLIGTYHTDVPRLGYFLTGDHLLEEVLWNYMRWFYRSCEAVFTPSRGVERELAARGLAVRFEPLDQAVDAEAFSPGRRDATLHHELGGEGHVILWVGRVSAEKNLELLAKAYAALREHRNDVSLVIVGDGPYRKTLEEVAPEATYLGFRSGEELARIYASSDVFVFPGAAETFGQVVLEAAMSGLPTVVTAGSIPSEAVVPGETALTVSPGNVDGMREAIETLLDDPRLRARMGAAARANAEGRTWKKAFAHFKDVYADVRW